MLSLINYGNSFGRRILLSNVDASFPAGSLTALLGRNGAGKSTLLRGIVGIGPHKGTVEVNGLNIADLSAFEAAKLISFVGTDRARVRAIKCKDIVGMGRAPYTGWGGRLGANDQKLVLRALDNLNMADFADRQADSLSDGEYQRIMIARALAQDTPVMILDEPTSFLDLPNRYDLCTLLARLAHDHNKCIVFSTHELDIALNLTDRIALIDNPNLIVADTSEMARSGHIARLFDPSRRLPAAIWSQWS